MRDCRIRVLAMSVRMLANILGAGEHPPYRITKDPLPGDAEIVGCEHNWNGVARFYIWSATFDVVPEGAEPPYLVPEDTRIDTWPTEEYERQEAKWFMDKVGVRT